MKKRIILFFSSLALIVTIFMLCLTPTFALTINSNPFGYSIVTYEGSTIYLYYHQASVDSPLTTNAVTVTYHMTSSNKASYLEYMEVATASINSSNINNYDATLLSVASDFYNCHSYAWLCNDPNQNSFWINDPSGFYQDGSYIEVLTPTIGDIICYYRDGDNKHSAVIVGVTIPFDDDLNGISAYIVNSKWGQQGLYRHNAYKCPYTHYAATVGEDDTDCATYVKFYRRVTPITYSQYNLSKHSYTCGGGHTHYESHVWTLVQPNTLGDSPQYFTMYECTKCGYIKFGDMA